MELVWRFEKVCEHLAPKACYDARSARSSVDVLWPFLQPLLIWPRWVLAAAQGIIVVVCGLSCPRAYVILAPQPGIKPTPLALESGHSATEPPGSPPCLISSFPLWPLSRIFWALPPSFVVFVVQSFSSWVQLFVTPWTAACQAVLHHLMEFAQTYLFFLYMISWGIFMTYTSPP